MFKISQKMEMAYRWKLQTSTEVEDLALSVESTSGVYFVPCFTGLYTPYWDPKARGTICGLTQFTTKAHIARAALEAICFQTREMVDAIEKDSEQKLRVLKVGLEILLTLFFIAT